MSRTVTASVSKTVDVEVDIDLDDFDDDDLIDELAARHILTPAEATRLKSGEPIGPAETEVASWHMRCGRRHEALIHLERALGRDWIGRLT
jgi:hypothetical protein